jgi:ssDNA thymidine ADP-ribosyltransferase, DarT
MALVDEFVRVLQATGRCLYHFTDHRNIDSIRERGLVSTSDLRRLGILTVTGGDPVSLHIDQDRGFDQFTRLSFCRQHPMAHVAREEGRIESVRILRVDPTVLLREGVRMADRVATSNDAVIGHPNEMIRTMDLEATYKWIDWKIAENRQRRHAAEKWEVMIPGVIQPADIKGL